MYCGHAPSRVSYLITLFSRTKRFKTQGSNQRGELFVVLEDKVSTARI